MKKYIYVIGLLCSFMTFEVGFTRFNEVGPDIFGIGFMTMTFVIGFLLATLWLKDKA